MSDRDDERTPPDDGTRDSAPGDVDRGTLTEREDGDGYLYTPPEVSRRNVAKLFVGASAAATLGTFAVSALTGLSDAGLVSNQGSLTYKNIYVKGTYLVDKEGKRLNAKDALPAGQGKELVVLPEQKKGVPLEAPEAVTLLLRFDEKQYKPPTNVDGTADGYVAYSMVCTHEGCLVSGRLGDDLHCPCHNSVYNPLEGAKVVGGPAPRPLPQLPIGVNQGDGNLLLATGPFEGPIGPQ